MGNLKNHRPAQARSYEACRQLAHLVSHQMSTWTSSSPVEVDAKTVASVTSTSVGHKKTHMWSSRADALQMIHQRLPEVANTRSDGPREVGGCIEELRDVSTVLDQQGFIGRPAWTELKVGVRPPPANLTEPGEWAHGWQFCASSVSEHHFRKIVVLAQSCPNHQAHLRSHSGGESSNVLYGCPSVLGRGMEALHVRSHSVGT